MPGSSWSAPALPNTCKKLTFQSITQKLCNFSLFFRLVFIIFFFRFFHWQHSFLKETSCPVQKWVLPPTKNWFVQDLGEAYFQSHFFATVSCHRHLPYPWFLFPLGRLPIHQHGHHQENQLTPLPQSFSLSPKRPWHRSQL